MTRSQPAVSEQSSPAVPVQTPSQALARQAMQALLDAQLIRPEECIAVEAKLIGGAMKAEDWITLAENALMSREQPELR